MLWSGQNYFHADASQLKKGDGTLYSSIQSYLDYLIKNKDFLESFYTQTFSINMFSLNVQPCSLIWSKKQNTPLWTTVFPGKKKEKKPHVTHWVIYWAQVRLGKDEFTKPGKL